MQNNNPNISFPNFESILYGIPLILFLIIGIVVYYVKIKPQNLRNDCMNQAYTELHKYPSASEQEKEAFKKVYYNNCLNELKR